MPSNYKVLGNYIRQVKVKNVNGEYSELLGININKFFMPSVANTIGVDLNNYLLVKKGQFACNRMHVGRDYRIPIALSDKAEPFLVSPAYDVFEIIDENILLPEYLMMWFRREEFDRNTWFFTDADVRGGLHWDAFCDLKLPIPTIEEQKAIVKEYNTVQNRININQQLNQKLEETAQALYKHWFVDFEFPTFSHCEERGTNDEAISKPYKSSGGRMLYNEELDKEIPEGWEVKSLSEIAEISAGGDKPKVFSEIKTSEINIPIYSNGITDDGLYGFTNRSNYPKDSVTISARGTIGFCVLRREPFDAIVRLIVLMPKFNNLSIYLWHTTKLIEFDNSGSVQNQLTKPQIADINILIPSSNILEHYQSIQTKIYNQIDNNILETQKLESLKSLLLVKMAKLGERDKIEI